MSYLGNSWITCKLDIGRVPVLGYENTWETGGGRCASCHKLYQKKDRNMFCSLLSTYQMSCKSILCQWSAHAPQLIFRQLSALLSPGYRDSKFSPCVVCWVSALKASQLLCPHAQGVFHPIAEKYFSFPILLTSSSSPQSAFLTSELRGSSALASPARLLLFCHACEDTSLLSLTPVFLKDYALEAAS